jgi:hypothetical protein
MWRGIDFWYNLLKLLYNLRGIEKVNAGQVHIRYFSITKMVFLYSVIGWKSRNGDHYVYSTQRIGEF